MTVQDEILALCTKMHAAGEVVTYEAIRSRRGGGSKRDISQALKGWRKLNHGMHEGKSLHSYRKDELRALVQTLTERLNENDEEMREQQNEIRTLVRKVKELRGYYPEDFEDDDCNTERSNQI